MIFHLSCKQATAILLQGEDRALTRYERLRLGFHMRICDACPRFLRQVDLMRRAMGEWRRYRDDE